MAEHAPSREEVQNSPLAEAVRPAHPPSELWRFTRRSVPARVAIGLFVGIFLMVPGLQIVGAALLAVPFRGNIPIAAAMTFLSNPATTPFFLIAAIEGRQPDRLPRRPRRVRGARDHACQRCGAGWPGSCPTPRRRWSPGLVVIGRDRRVRRILGVARRMALVDRAQMAPAPARMNGPRNARKNS